MNLFVFSKDKIAIDIDKIELITQAKYNSEYSDIYFSGSDSPITIHKPFDDVVSIIRENGINRCR